MLNAEQKKVIILSSMGGLLEFYDFTVYGLFAVYFSSQFFPSHDVFISIMASYSVFVVGYIARPIGGIIFSHIGDEIGRKTVMILTMILMGLASLGLGLTPTYAQIGIWAPILMILFRLIQGLAIGGELPSMIVYVSESIPGQRGLAMGGIFSGTVAGLLPGMILNLLIIHYLSTEQINSFGWRIPFILGGLLCIVAYQVRRKLHESAAFTSLKEHNNLPIVELLKHHLGKVFIGVGLVSIMATPITLAIIFMPTYLIKILKLDKATIGNAILIATCISVVAIYSMGVLADKIKLYKLFVISSLLLVVAAAVCYYMLAQQMNVLIALSIFALMQGALVALPPILLSYLFPIHIRLSGVAISYNISFVLFAGLTPIVVSGLIEKTHMVYLVPVLCMAFTVLVTLFALSKSRKYTNIPN
jgi:MFS family permease